MFVSDFYATQEGKDYLKLAFSKNFSHQAVVINGNLVSMGDGGFIEIDKYNEYKINQFGFRENEFNSDSIDILAVGCSFTFGVGVPNNCAWPRMFDNQYKTINLGSPGISAETILMNTLKYINLFF